MEFKHKKVLLNECIEGLNIKQDGIYVDGTLGGAGHSKEILKRLDKNKGILIGIDRDEEALQRESSHQALHPAPRRSRQADGRSPGALQDRAYG